MNEILKYEDTMFQKDSSDMCMFLFYLYVYRPLVFNFLREQYLST